MGLALETKGSNPYFRYAAGNGAVRPQRYTRLGRAPFSAGATACAALQLLEGGDCSLCPALGFSLYRANDSRRLGSLMESLAVSNGLFETRKTLVVVFSTLQ